MSGTHNPKVVVQCRRQPAGKAQEDTNFLGLRVFGAGEITSTYPAEAKNRAWFEGLRQRILSEWLRCIQIAGTVLKTNVDVERARLIRATLAEAPGGPGA